VSSQRTAEHTSPSPQKPEPTVSVEVSEDDLVGLRRLANAAGVSESDFGHFGELLSFTLHRGIVESSKTAGLPWPPDSAELDVRKHFGALDGTTPTGAASHRPRTQTVRYLALGVAAVATLILIIGSYAGDWSWTGLTQNGQVWDWMQLLLLPVALGTFPLWLRFSGQMGPTRRRALGCAVLAFFVFVLLGYILPLTWTGFRGHTLWDWLTLIVLPITITTATIWPKTGRTLRPFYVVAASALGLAWVVTLIGGYIGDWTWTGYPGNTLWEWVELLLAPIAITTCIVPELIRVVAGKAADGTTPGADG
jgi:hypothetical protein